MDYTLERYDIKFYGEPVTEEDRFLRYDEMMERKEEYMKRGLEPGRDFYVKIV